MNPRLAPFFRFLCPFAGGLALGGYIDVPIPFLLIILIGLAILIAGVACLSIPFRWRWVFGTLVMIWFFGAGYHYCVSHSELRSVDHFSLKDKAGYVLGMVYDVPSGNGILKIPIQVEAIGSSPDSLHGASGNLLLFVKVPDTTLDLHYGDRILVRATPKPTESPKNPNAFSYKRYLHFQNIHFQAFIKPDSLLVLDSGHGNFVWNSAFYCRGRLLKLLQKYFPTTDEYAVACALLVGYKDDLSEDLRTAYAETGSMHALAVSGTHVGLLYIGLMFLLSRSRLKGRWRLAETVIVLIAIWAFTFLTGASASVLRATVMFSTYLMAKLLRRDANVWNIISASALGLLIYNPYFLYDAGFQLSYAAVGGMVFFVPLFQRYLPAFKNRWVHEFWGTFFVGIAAQLGTIPLSLYYFNQFPYLFWLSGWFVVLGGAIFLWCSALLVILDGISQSLAEILGTMLYYLVLGMNKIIFAIQSIPYSVAKGVWVSWWAVGVLYICVWLIGKTMMTRQTKYVLYFFGLMIMLGIYRNSNMLDKTYQKNMVVYHINQKRMIDFFVGRKVVTLSDSVAAKQVKFAAEANRWTYGIKDISVPMPMDTPFYKSDNLWIQRPFVQFFDRSLVLIDDVKWLKVQDDGLVLSVDYVIISNNPKLSIKECQARFPCKKVIFDTSNSWKNTAKWMAECRAEGLAFHDVRSQGAWEDYQ